MRATTTTLRALVAALVVAALLGCGYAVVAFTRHLRSDTPTDKNAASPDAPHVESDSVEMSARALEQARIKTAEAVVSTRPRTLDLRGALAIDPNRLVHVHARFPGQVVELAKADGGKPLGFMDKINQGQDLAVLWSKDLGEKKSELVDALARLRLDRQALDRLKKLYEKGGTTEAAVRGAELQVELDEVAASRAERTLRSWMLNDQEIDVVKAEAERLGKREERQPDRDSDWARLEIPAPIEGTIVEKNVAIGDIVDTNTDLFKIADLATLNVWLHAYEEDLPYLGELPKPIKIRIRLPSSPNLGIMDGTIDRIGDIIDPNEHMALLIGSINNDKGELRAGQFVTATVELPPDRGVVEIPSKALIDDGNQSYVFVQPDPNVLRFVRRPVAVARRYYDVVFVRSHLNEAQRAAGLVELHPGERVVSSGISQLEELLQSGQSAEPSPAQRKPAQAASSNSDSSQR
jgi:cobalt-zinc-cadmium efflux system membrane fusion protein